MTQRKGAITIAGRCRKCSAPVRLFCLDCAREMLPGDKHKKACTDAAALKGEEPSATEIWMCMCLPRDADWGVRPKRFRKPKMYDQPNLPITKGAV